MKLPRALQKLIESFERLPGIGPKTASRLAFYLLHTPQAYLDEFAQSLENLKKNTVTCSICYNVAEADPCPICADQTREKALICVLEEPLDLLAIEKTGKFSGVYHLLHGSISPLNNIGPDELYIEQLIDRLKNAEVKELIIATNPNMEGEATAMYIAKQVSSLKENNLKLKSLKVTRIGQGLPTGSDLEYADEVTLTRAIEGRKEY